VLRRRFDGSLPGLIAGIPADQRDELGALAAVAGLPEDQLLAANVTVDAWCSALVRGGRLGGGLGGEGEPLRLARNMDFFPAEVIGPNTVVAVVRPRGRYAFASIGWPGYVGVVSGMNEHGLVACILLRYGAESPRLGLPMASRVRQILERSANLEEALVQHAAPVASGHYLLLADAQSAAIAWHQQGGLEAHRLRSGWLCCDNDERACGLGMGERAVALGRLAAGLKSDAEADAQWMRRALGASYQNGVNAQAMVFTPAERGLQLALGTALKPAALGNWWELDLRGALAGAGLSTVAARGLPKPLPVPHFTAR
jgi:hypothetical protein